MSGVDCPCCASPWEAVFDQVANEDTMGIYKNGTARTYPWFFITSGRFTQTVKTSADFSSYTDAPSGIGHDGSNSFGFYSSWNGGSSESMYRWSGLFTTTVKSSYDVSSTYDMSTGCWDGVNTMWCGWDQDEFGFRNNNFLYLQSGAFTSTVKTSLNIESIGGSTDYTYPTWDETDTTICSDALAHDWKLLSGQYTSTVKTSIAFSSGDRADDPCRVLDGYLSEDNARANHYSGQFSSTIKSSGDYFPSGALTPFQSINTEELNYG